MALNAKFIENLKPEMTLYRRADGQGLTIVILPNGSKTWQLRYKFNNKSKTFSLGRYPTTSLAEARLKALQAKESIRNGVDPSAVKKQEKRLAILNSQNTFEALAIEWHERNKDTWNKKHSENIISRLKRDAFPHIGNTPIADLKAPDIAAVIKKIEDRGFGETARRVLQICGQVIRYAVQTGRAPYDVTSGLKGFLKRRTRTHYASIEVNKLPELVKKIRKNDARLFKQTRIALELMMLTFVRTSELINAKWEEFDFEQERWIIPAERMKMRQEHLVPLSKQALSLLNELRGTNARCEHVFPSIPRPHKPMSNGTLLKALEKLGYHGKMTGHGFRALAMTAIQEQLGIEFTVIDRQLAHKPRSSVQQAYDRTKFLDKRRNMMQAWADYIDRLHLSVE